MSKITIAGSNGYDECDCCGSFEWETYIVKVDGEVVLDHTGDTHMGGGVWYCWEEAVRDILTAMGHTVEVNIEEDTP